MHYKHESSRFKNNGEHAEVPVPALDCTYGDLLLGCLDGSTNTHGLICDQRIYRDGIGNPICDFVVNVSLVSEMYDKRP